MKRFLLLLVCTVFAITQSLYAKPEKEEQQHAATEHHAEHAPEKFQADKLIFEHITDAHEWHILTYKHKHVSIPLPIILYSEGKLHMFCSSKFEHGHKAYKGFQLMTEGDNKGKIVYANAPEADKKPLDFSITKNVLAIFISIFLLLLIFMSVAKSYKKREGHAPKGLQNLLEPVILFVRDDIAIPSIGKKKYEKYMPFLLTVFFFIFINNLLGIIPFFPGGANVTGNIAVTMILAILTFIITSFSGNKAYWTHIVNSPGVPWWLKFPVPLMPIVEIIGVFTKPFVLMVRLFANILAGHIIILGFFSLIFIFGSMKISLGYGVSVVSILFGVFMSLIELLVAFIQAYVFTLLSALYFGMATEEHH